MIDDLTGLLTGADQLAACGVVHALEQLLPVFARKELPYINSNAASPKLAIRGSAKLSICQHLGSHDPLQTCRWVSPSVHLFLLECSVMHIHYIDRLHIKSMG